PLSGHHSRQGRPAGRAGPTAAAMTVDTEVSFGGFRANHSTMLGIAGSKGPGDEKLRTPARTLPRFSKSCVTPPGTRMKEPFGHSNHSSPTRTLIVPSMT